MKELTIRCGTIVLCGIICFISLWLSNETTTTETEIADESLINISIKDYEDGELAFVSTGKYHFPQLYYTNDNYRTIIQYNQKNKMVVYKYDLSPIIERFPKSNIEIIDVHDDSHQMVVAIRDGWRLKYQEIWIVSSYPPVRIKDPEKTRDFNFLINGDMVYVDQEDLSLKVWHHQDGYFETILKGKVLAISEISHQENSINNIDIYANEGHIIIKK